MAVLRILLIEDNADDAELIALELAEHGIAHELHRVELRQELDAALLRDDWSVVVCDSRLPGYSGAEAAHWVRERLPRVPLVFCVGISHIEDADLAAAIEAGDGWIDKDRLHELPAAIRRVTADGYSRLS